MTIRFSSFHSKEITTSALCIALGLIPFGTAACLLTGCGKADAIQETGLQIKEADQDAGPQEEEADSAIKKVLQKNNGRLTYDAIKEYSRTKYKRQSSSIKVKPFKVVNNGDPVGAKTIKSPFDSITRPQIPFELQSRSRNARVIKVLPADAKLVGNGRYYCRQKNWQYYMYQTENDKKVEWSGKEIPKCMSHSGKLCLSGRNALYETFKPRKNHFFENLKTHNQGQLQRAVFSPTEKLIVGDDYGKIHIVSAETRRHVQTIENAYFPVHLSYEDRCLYCFDKEKNLMIYVWTGRQFVGMGKKQLTNNERLQENITDYLGFGDGFIVVAKNAGKPEESFKSPDGLTVFSTDGLKLRKIFERDDWGSSVTKPCTRGKRFAFIRSADDDSSRWIVYGDAETGKIKQIPFQAKNFDAYSAHTELDVSGRYLFVGSSGPIQVIKLESN